MSRETLEAKTRFETACREEGAETHRLGTMSPKTRELWRRYVRLRLRDEGFVFRRSGR